MPEIQLARTQRIRSIVKNSDGMSTKQVFEAWEWDCSARTIRRDMEQMIMSDVRMLDRDDETGIYYFTAGG